MLKELFNKVTGQSSDTSANGPKHTATAVATNEVGNSEAPSEGTHVATHAVRQIVMKGAVMK